MGRCEKNVDKIWMQQRYVFLEKRYKKDESIRNGKTNLRLSKTQRRCYSRQEAPRPILRMRTTDERKISSKAIAKRSSLFILLRRCIEAGWIMRIVIVQWHALQNKSRVS